MIALVVVAAVAAAWTAVRRSRRGAARRDAARDLPRLAGDLARSLRSGATLRTALAEQAERRGGLLGAELQEVVGSVQRGTALDGALHEWARRSPVPGVELLTGACRFGSEHGGDVDRALDGVGASLLDALDVQDEVRALASQARTSAAVLVLLPPVGAVLFAVADPSVATVLASGPGMACLVAGASLDAVGAWISVRLVRGALR